MRKLTLCVRGVSAAMVVSLSASWDTYRGAGNKLRLIVTRGTIIIFMACHCAIDYDRLWFAQKAITQNQPIIITSD